MSTLSFRTIVFVFSFHLLLSYLSSIMSDPPFAAAGTFILDVERFLVSSNRLEAKVLGPYGGHIERAKSYSLGLQWGEGACEHSSSGGFCYSFVFFSTCRYQDAGV